MSRTGFPKRRKIDMTKPLKSVHLTNYYHKNSGGISTAYNKLLEAANRHERFVRLIVPGEREEVEEIGEYGKIYYVPALQSPVFDKRYRILLPWQYLSEDTLIRNILAAEMPDIIEIGEKYSLSLLAGIIHKGHLKELNRPMLVHFTCERMDDNINAFIGDNKPLKWFARRVTGNYIFPMFDFHLANSHYTAQELFDAVGCHDNPPPHNAFFNFCWRYFRAATVPLEERVFVNQCGADINSFSRERRRAEFRREILKDHNLPENARLLLYAGRISPEKNIQLLVDLMRLLVKDADKNYYLLVAGAGPQTDWLKKQSELLGGNKIVFLGHFDKETLANYYANADVFVHPNPREPFGIAPLEAMASGTPVLVPNSGGLLSYATDENAWLAEPTAENFAAGVLDILDDDQRRERKIARAFETSRNFSWEHSTDRLFATYDRLYADFRQRNEFFSDEAAAKDFNFTQLLNYK